MEKQEICITLNEIFKKVFSDDTLVINDEMSAEDVENWGSLTNMEMIATVEETFGIKFKLKELNKMKNVGDIISTIQSKI